MSRPDPSEQTPLPNPELQQQAQPSSPSPPPQPPTALTPGPRATAFTTLYSKTLSATLSAISYEAFSECFPTIASNAENELRGMHYNMCEKLRGFALDEFEGIIRERRVVENLNSLEDIISDARRRKGRAVEEEEDVPVAPHTLPPAPLLAAHLSPILNSQQSHLNASLQTIESQNAQLLLKIEEQKKEIRDLVGGLEGLVRDLEGAAGLVGDKGMELERESRQAELDLSLDFEGTRKGEDGEDVEGEGEVEMTGS